MATDINKYEGQAVRRRIYVACGIQRRVTFRSIDPSLSTGWFDFIFITEISNILRDQRRTPRRERD